MPSQRHRWLIVLVADQVNRRGARPHFPSENAIVAAPGVFSGTPVDPPQDWRCAYCGSQGPSVDQIDHTSECVKRHRLDRP